MEVTAYGNPWIHLPTEPDYVLESDRKHVEEFNTGARDEHKIHLDLFPEPYIGQCGAPVVLLGLNPGYDANDCKIHRNQRFAELSRANLEHNLKFMGEFPFYFLNPELKKLNGSEVPGSKWWTQRLGHLVKEDGCKWNQVANSILCIEYFPYHSRKYKSCTRLKSQTYSFNLVQKAIERKAIIIALRSVKLWIDAVPGLETYKDFHRVNSPQNPTLTRNNLPGCVYDEIVERIKK